MGFALNVVTCLSGVFCIIYITYLQLHMYFRCRKTFYTCLQIFYYNPESKEDIHLAHIELPITSPKTLTDPRAVIVFQPTAQASPAHTKTNRRLVDQLELGVIFFRSMCAKWMSSSDSGL